MAGMMWRRCMILLVFCAWQTCSATELVNLVEPHLTENAPQGSVRRAIGQRLPWKLFDRDLSTNHVAKNVKVFFQPPYTTRPTKYRITMGARVSSADYPSSWKVIATTEDPAVGERFTLDEVTSPVFDNGMYEGTLSQQIGLAYIAFKFFNSVTIAEIELLGPRSALNALWPYGKYPCSERLAVITNKKGPKKVFSSHSPAFFRQEVRHVFSARSIISTRFNLRDNKPLIIGAELPELPMVQGVSIVAFRLRDLGIKKVVLQGSFCEPHCAKFGSKGWVRLGVARPLPDPGRLPYDDGPDISVSNPGKYKAYRLKFFTRIYPSDHPLYLEPGTQSVYLRGIYFQGCTA